MAASTVSYSFEWDDTNSLSISTQHHLVTQPFRFSPRLSSKFSSSDVQVCRLNDIENGGESPPAYNIKMNCEAVGVMFGSVPLASFSVKTNKLSFTSGQVAQVCNNGVHFHRTTGVFDSNVIYEFQILGTRFRAIKMDSNGLCFRIHTVPLGNEMAEVASVPVLEHGYKFDRSLAGSGTTVTRKHSTVAKLSVPIALSALQTDPKFLLDEATASEIFICIVPCMRLLFMRSRIKLIMLIMLFVTVAFLCVFIALAIGLPIYFSQLHHENTQNLRFSQSIVEIERQNENRFNKIKEEHEQRMRNFHEETRNNIEKNQLLGNLGNSMENQMNKGMKNFINDHNIFNTFEYDHSTINSHHGPATRHDYGPSHYGPATHHDYRPSHYDYGTMTNSHYGSSIHF